MAAVEDRQQKDKGGKMFEEDIYLFSSQWVRWRDLSDLQLSWSLKVVCAAFMATCVSVIEFGWRFVFLALASLNPSVK